MATTSVQPSSSVEADTLQTQPQVQKRERRARRRLRIYGLQGKLILPYVVLTLVLAGLGVFIVTQLVTSSVKERFNNQVYVTTRSVNDSFVRLERRHLDILRLMLSVSEVPQYLRAKDVAGLDAKLRPIMANQRVEILTAVDLEGKEIFTLGLSQDKQAYQITQGGADLSKEWLVTSIIRKVTDSQGDKFAQLLKTQMGWVLFTSAPVRDASGELSGILMVGSYMDTVVSEIKKINQADLIVLDLDYNVIAASVPEPEEGFEHYQKIARQAKPGGEAQTVNTTYDRTPYAIAFNSLLVRGRAMGWTGVLLPANYVAAVESTNRDFLSLVFALSTVMFIILGYFLAQNIAAPLLKLRAMTQAVAEGDLNQRIQLERADEIGDLANAFDIMTAHLKERTERVEQLLEETQQRNRQLHEMNERLKATQLQLVQSEKLAAIGQLTAGIVHDVKNPFAVIMGMTDVLQDEKLDENILHGLKVIRESAQKGNTIVSDLLKFARQSKAEMRLNDLRETVEASMRLTAYLTRRYELISELPEKSLYTTYDSQQIEQVLINMIHNAVQAMPNGGRLRIALKTVDQNALIEIEDTGTGIAPEHLQRIFDPFFTTKPEGEGTGLGLSVSYGIIANHQGRIEVDSEVGRGTKFTIILPIIKTNYASEGQW